MDKVRRMEIATRRREEIQKTKAQRTKTQSSMTRTSSDMAGLLISIGKIVQREESGQSKEFEEGKWCSSHASATAEGVRTQPGWTRFIIYNVPLHISTDDLVACLASQGVKFVKRFRFKCSDSSELKDSKSVFLQFTTADLLGEVKIGYLFFHMKQIVPRPSRCFKCNRYGHVTGHCQGKLHVLNLRWRT